MRRTRRLLALASGALLLAGCSAADSAPSGSAGSDAGDDSGFPVTIEHAYGSTVITERPERVVVVGLSEQDALLALGVVPVATTTWIPGADGNIWPWAEDALGDADRPEVLESEQDFERVAGMEPDLIVALYSSISAKDYELYSAIAPTLAKPEGTVDYGVSWREVVTTLGQALGEQEQAGRLVSDVDDAFARPGSSTPSSTRPRRCR